MYWLWQFAQRAGHWVAHTTHWNFCKYETDGYRCIKCGEFTPWEDD